MNVHRCTIQRRSLDNYPFVTPYPSRRHVRRTEEVNLNVPAVILPEVVQKELDAFTLPNRQLHTYALPYDVTYAHHDFVRDDGGDKTFTLAFIKAASVCIRDACKGCVTCVSKRCAWCKELLIDQSCTFDVCSDNLPTALEDKFYIGSTKFYYKVNVLVSSVVPHAEKYLFMRDQQSTVCASCVHSSILEMEPVCHDENNTNLYKLRCKAMESRLDAGLQKQLDQIELYSYSADGTYYKLPPSDLVKVLETCRYRDLEDLDQIVYYGQLEADRTEDKRIVSQELNLTPSEIAKLVADCSV